MPTRTNFNCRIEGCTAQAMCRQMCGTHYQRWRLTGNPTTPISELHKRARWAELHIYGILYRHGREVSRCGYKAPYDMLVDGWRVDVKSAVPRFRGKMPYWKFFLKPDKRQEDCDFYVMRLVDIPFCDQAIHMLFPAPLGTTTFTVSFHSLLERHSSHVQLFRAFCNGKYGKKEAIAAD